MGFLHSTHAPPEERAISATIFKGEEVTFFGKIMRFAVRFAVVVEERALQEGAAAWLVADEALGVPVTKKNFRKSSTVGARADQ